MGWERVRERAKKKGESPVVSTTNMSFPCRAFYVHVDLDGRRRLDVRFRAVSAIRSGSVALVAAIGGNTG